MLFDSSKKNYYRFPSLSSIHEMDSRYYFPDKPYSNGENIRQDPKPDKFTNDEEMYTVFK